MTNLEKQMNIVLVALHDLQKLSKCPPTDNEQRISHYEDLQCMIQYIDNIYNNFDFD